MLGFVVNKKVTSSPIDPSYAYSYEAFSPFRCPHPYPFCIDLTNLTHPLKDDTFKCFEKTVTRNPNTKGFTHVLDGVTTRIPTVEGLYW